jgi:hypothetical protein
MAFNESNAQFVWGTQPPSVPNPIPLTLVNDTFDDGRGPAWWLKVQYNKTVLVPEDNFRVGGMQRRTWNPNDHLPEDSDLGPFKSNEYSPDDFDPTSLKKANKGAVEGDKPWICTWPGTVLEVFIYPNANASLQVSATATTEPDYTAPTPSYDEDGDGDADVNDYSDREGPLRAYPKVVKFLERRFSGGPNSTASCRQVRIVKGGYGMEDCTDEDGDPIVVEIVEKSTKSDEDPTANHKREVTRTWYSETNSLTKRTQQELTSCGCLWWST